MAEQARPQPVGSTRPIYAAAAVVLLALLLIALVAAWAVERARHADARVRATHDRLITLERALSTLKDAETGQRGFLLTGDAAYLGPYNDAVSRLADLERGLRALPGDGAAAADIDRFSALSRDKLEELAQTVDLARRGRMDEALGVVRSGRGRETMDRLRELAGRLQVEASLERSRSIDDAHRRAVEATAIILVGSAAVWGATLTVVAVALRHLARARAAQAALTRLAGTLEVRVAERTRELTEANAELETFGHTVSHDLRAPLRSMQGFAHALQEDYADRLDDRARLFLSRISGAASRMDRLIQDLLAYSRLARADLAPERTSLTAAVSEALRQVGDDLSTRGARIDVQPDMPAVLAHRAALVQAIANLLANAGKFVAPGRPPVIRVRAEREPAGRWVRLSVEDEGIGIEPEHHERIFGVFERLHGSDAYEGTGVGLAIVKRVAERLGGAVGVDSAPGRGSRFWMRLPAPEA